MDDVPLTSPPGKLHRSLGLVQATAMNMSNMVGVGPFLTIPLILGSMEGPQAMLGWILGAVLAVCDGLVWAELASAIPSSGGTFEYLKVAYAKTRLAHLLPFLFIWQFLFSGPLEIASGNIGFAQYSTYLQVAWELTPRQIWLIFCIGVVVAALVLLLLYRKIGWVGRQIAVVILFMTVTLVVGKIQWLALGVGGLAMLLLYRKIEWVGRLMVALWAGVILTVAVVLISGLRNFDASKVLDFPPEAFTLTPKFFLGLGSALSLAMYSYLGYFSVCNIGEEVKNPTRTIPWSILISVFLVAAIYLAMNISIISVIPWRRAIQEKEFIASVFMEWLYGPLGGQIMTVLICWTAFASVFALMLGYSRIPFAAARDGFFFSPFARLHPRGDFPFVSLLVLGAVTMAASFLPLEAVIQTLLTARILVQFIAQIGAVALLRHRGTNPATFRMWGYPLPSAIALVGWGFIFWTSENIYISGSLLILNLGMVAFLVWSWISARKPSGGL